MTPIEIYLSGRAITSVGDISVPFEEIAIEGSRAWLREHLHALDANRHVRLHNLLRPGSRALGELFGRRSGGGPSSVLANDTSFGVGYAPMTALELLVLRTERLLNGRPRASSHPAWGEDVKVMGVRCGSRSFPDYRLRDDRPVSRQSRRLPGRDRDDPAQDFRMAAECGFDNGRVHVNVCRRFLALGLVYLTVTGTSAEAGDDGQVGRGNRVNGLITPGCSMSLEAVVVKNPVSHVGNRYNVLAQTIAEAIVSEPYRRSPPRNATW